MSNIDLQLLEDQLLLPEEDQLAKLIKGTDQYYYFYFLKIFNQHGYILTEEQKEQYAAYIDTKTMLSQKILIRSLLLEYDHLSNQIPSESIEQQQKNILEKLNKNVFHFSFSNIQAPANRESQSQAGLIEQKLYKSKFDDDLLKMEKYFEKAYTEKGFYCLNPALYCHLNFKKLAQSSLQIIKAFLEQVGNEIIDFTNIPFLFNHLANLKEFNNQFKQMHFRKLSISQMEEILALNQGFMNNEFFVGEFYLKKFQHTLQNIQHDKLTEKDKQEVLLKLLDVYQWTNTLPPKFKSFSDQILFELLQLGIEINQYNFDLFLVFLKNPKENYNYASQEQRTYIQNNKRSYQNQWHQYHKLNINRWMSTNQIIEKYLQKYFQNFEEINIFEQFLETSYLRRIYAEVKLYQGQTIEKVYHFLSSPQIEQINKSKLISICSFNKVYFKHGEPVQLQIELKNIPNLNIKIFEFNSENYFLSKQQPLNSEINLDGLLAFEEINFTYTYPPIQKVIKEFEFETISKRQRGVFIIEFIGNGISSRAIIKKGRLQLRETITVAGHRFQILDENFELCSGDKTGVWIDKKFHQIDQQRKEILIPFGERDQQFNAILVHENYAEFTEISIQKESYSLKCAFLIADEQLLMGAQAKAVILTKLYVNGTEVGLNLLEDQKVTVTCTNDAGVPSTIPFDNLKLETDKPVEVQFPITAKLKEVQIKVSGKVKRMHQSNGNKEEYLEQSHVVTFDNWEGKGTFCNQYLKYDEKNGYQICIVGKNGEPKQDQEITVTFNLLMINDKIIEVFKSNENGKVYLGQLDNVKTLTSCLRPVVDVSVQQKIWQIQQASAIQYPNKLIVLKGEQVRLPVLAMKKEVNVQKNFMEIEDEQILFKAVQQKKQNLALYEIINVEEMSTVQSLTHLIQVENQFISFILERKGNYALEFIKDRQTVFIDVVEGEKWKGSNYLKVNNQLIINKGNEQVIGIQKIEKLQTENGTKITGVISSQLKPIVYAYASSYVNERFNFQVDQIVKFLNQSKTEQIEIDLYSNIFQSNKELSDEQKYVLNRKTSGRYIGNTLEKPQLLLKRQLIRETTTEGEQLNQGHSYENAYKEREKSYERKVEKKQKCKNFQQSELASSYSDQIITTFQDFLKYPAQLYSNIQLDTLNQFEVYIPNFYSTVTFLVFHNYSYQQILVPLQNEQIDTRNLVHHSTLEKDKFYSIYRNSHNVEKNQLIQVQDLTSTEIKLVDSLSKLFIILKELRKAQGNESDSRDFQKWEFLVKWNQQMVEQKHKLYDEYQCDELNLFIYFKDFAYFETYTKSYINNKIEKRFIDYFLLEDEKQLRNYGSIAKLEELNALEQALLVIYFAEILNQPEDAQLIAQYLENINKQNLIDQRIYKKYFDTVLGVKVDTDEQQFIQAEVEVCVQMSQMLMQQPALQRRRRVLQKEPGQKRIRQTTPSDYFFNCEVDLPSPSNNYYAEKRSDFIENFKNLEKTKEYCEKHYSNGTQKDNNKNLVSLNGFFVELANHSVNKGILREEFLSSKFLLCNNNQTEMIAVLALISLPFEAPEQVYQQFGSKGIEILIKSSGIFFLKEVKEGKAQLRQDILIAQRFFDPNDRYYISEEDPELKLEKDINQFLINKIYGCQVIITNCSSTIADYQVLVEVPNGSIPVDTTFYTKSYTITCQPYSTQRLEYFFYFPQIGQFTVYPANVSRFGQVVCVAQERNLFVDESKQIKNLDAIEDILAKGSKGDILNFLQTKNIFNKSIFKAEDIRYLLGDKEFYFKVIEIYRRRKFSDIDSFKFAILHNDKQGLKDLFVYKNCQKDLNQYFKYFKSSLFEVNTIRLLEYYPLVTKRVHNLTSDAKRILNVELRNQYIDYLTYLIEKSNHSLSDKLVFIYYLLLQERINEAIQIYNTLPEKYEQGEAVLQYDYFTAYLDFYIGYPNFLKARQICEKYLNYPVIQWRNLFYEVANLLAEFDGDDDQIQKLNSESTQKQKHLQQAQKEETLESMVEGNEISITYSNLDSVTIQFYKIDIEILFSLYPFLSQAEEDFAFVLPYQILTVKLDEQKQTGMFYKKVIMIPDELRKSNLFIQVSGITKKTSNRYYSTQLKIQVMENYGQIRVFDQQNKYHSKVYVKAYVKDKNGKESFYKDGYTDLRGRFDYASLSSSNLGDIQKFSLLIISDEYGSIIKEISPPTQVGKFESEVKLISKNWAQKAVMEQEKQSLFYEVKKKCKQ